MVAFTLAAADPQLDGRWDSIPPPLERDAPLAIYDPVRDQVVVFGGLGNDYNPMGDVWALELGSGFRWRRLHPVGEQPAARVAHAGLYDPVGERLLVFGGAELTGGPDNCLDDVWSLSLAGTPTWSRIQVPGDSPGPRAGHSVVYDSMLHRALLFGGSACEAPDLNDVWSLSLGDSPAWSEIPTTSSEPLPGLSGHGAVYDPVRNQMVIRGGHLTGQTWILSLAANEWRRTNDLCCPQSTRGNPLAYDATLDRVLITVESGVWSLVPEGDFPSWTEVHPPWDPPIVYDAGVVFDPVRNRLIRFAGTGSPTFINETWTFPLGTAGGWSQVPLVNPIARSEHGAVLDPAGSRMIVFGGLAPTYPVPLADVWELDYSGDPVWSERTLAGPGPSPRWGHSAVYDPVGHRVIVMGGEGSGSSGTGDCWSLTLDDPPTWSLLTAHDPSRDLFRHRAVFDSTGNRMVVFGGDNGDWVDDVWILDLADTSWANPYVPGVGPGGLFGHSMVYDSLQRRAIVFGGDSGTASNETWVLALGDSLFWSPLATMGTPPSGRALHTAVFDPGRNRMVVFGGYTAGLVRSNETWTLSLSGTPTWSRLTPDRDAPSPRAGHSAAYDLARDRMLVFGGDANLVGGTYELSWENPTSISPEPPSPEVPSPIADALRLSPPVPNPFSHSTAVRYELPRPGIARAVLWNAAGRRVAVLVDRRLTAGSHTLTWNGTDTEGDPVSPGVYFLRVEFEGDVRTSKIAVIR